MLSAAVFEVYELATGTLMNSIKNLGGDEVQSFEYLQGTDSILVSHWNSTVIEIRDAKNWSLLSKVDVAEYAPYSSVEVDQI